LKNGKPKKKNEQKESEWRKLPSVSGSRMLQKKPCLPYVLVGCSAICFFFEIFPLLLWQKNKFLYNTSDRNTMMEPESPPSNIGPSTTTTTAEDKNNGDSASENHDTSDPIKVPENGDVDTHHDSDGDDVEEEARARFVQAMVHRLLVAHVPEEDWPYGIEASGDLLTAIGTAPLGSDRYNRHNQIMRSVLMGNLEPLDLLAEHWQRELDLCRELEQDTLRDKPFYPPPSPTTTRRDGAGSHLAAHQSQERHDGSQDPAMEPGREEESEQEQEEDYDWVCPVAVARCVGPDQAWVVLIRGAAQPYVVVPESSPAVDFLLQRILMEFQPLSICLDPVTGRMVSPSLPSWSQLRRKYLFHRWVPFGLRTPGQLDYQPWDRCTTHILFETPSLESSEDQPWETPPSPSFSVPPVYEPLYAPDGGWGANVDMANGDVDLEKNHPMESDSTSAHGLLGYRFEMTSPSSLHVIWLQQGIGIDFAYKSSATLPDDVPYGDQESDHDAEDGRPVFNKQKREEANMFAMLAKEDEDAICSPYADLDAECEPSPNSYKGQVRKKAESWGTSLSKSLRGVMSVMGLMDPTPPPILPSSQQDLANAIAQDAERVPVQHRHAGIGATPGRKSVRFKESNDDNDDDHTDNARDAGTGETLGIQDFATFPLLHGRWYRMTLHEYRTWLCVAQQPCLDASLMHCLKTMTADRPDSDLALPPWLASAVETTPQARALASAMRSQQPALSKLSDAHHRLLAMVQELLDQAVDAKDDSKKSARHSLPKTHAQVPLPALQVLEQVLQEYHAAHKACFRSSSPSQPPASKQESNKETV
jgi:hypothetical protein